MDQIFQKILELIASITLGSFGALVRLITLDPKKISLVQIFLEMIIGAFVGAMTWIILSNVTGYSSLTICGWSGVLGVMSKECIKTVVFVAKKEATEKYGVKFEK